jgi:hypothetical protein
MAAGGVWLRPQKRVPLARAAMHMPSKLCPAGPVAAHAVPEDFPLQASTRKLGGGGKSGTQATPVPSNVARQLPGKLQPPSLFPVSEHASPTALPEQASSIPVEGAHRRGAVLCPAPASRAVLAVLEVLEDEAPLPAPPEPVGPLHPTTSKDARPAKASVCPGTCRMRHLNQTEFRTSEACQKPRLAPKG